MKRTRAGFTAYLRLIIPLFLISYLPHTTLIRSSQSTGIAAELSALPGELWIVVQKSRNVLTLYKGMRPFKSYWAAFGKGYDKGDKLGMGDKRTPEGIFYICSMNHSERFYKFMGISYPDVRHAEHGLSKRLITASEYLEIKKAIEERRQPPWDTKLGGAIGIHGRMIDSAIKRVPNPQNWTDGCIALENADVDEIFSVASIGTPVLILP